MPTKYDDQIKQPGLEIEYTSEMIRDLKKCSQDFFYFCKFLKITHPDEGRIIFQPRDYQKDAIDIVLKNRFSIFLFPRQCR